MSDSAQNGTARRRALLSVSDKSGIEEFGRALVDRGWEVLSTGGTARQLRDAGIEVTDVSSVTGFPEMMDGRVKTLHPAIHGGLLARREKATDLAELSEQGYQPIDLVAVNLYPFRETVAQDGVTMDQAMEKVDIGGPTMIRAAAKNHRSVWVVVDPLDYGSVLEALESDLGADEDGKGRDEALSLRRRLAMKTFEHISSYDHAVTEHLRRSLVQGEASSTGDSSSDLPQALSVDLQKLNDLRYGENPDQRAAFYAPEGVRFGVPALEQHHGKALSYNNILDLDGALLVLAPFAFSPKPAVAIIKHTTPCGLAIGDTVRKAFDRARATDPMSSFGSIIATNRVVDQEAAEGLATLFVECLVAPGYTPEAMETLTAKKNIRIMTIPGGASNHPAEPVGGWWSEAEPSVRDAARFLAHHSAEPVAMSYRSVYGGALVQTPLGLPFYGIPDASWKVVTEREPTEEEIDDLAFAWAAVAGVKSNAILLAGGGGTIGIGAGQMSRVDSSLIAIRKAGDAGLPIAGASLASDAYFPFRDGLDAVAEAGVTSVIQPGGSVRDEEVIQAANEHGVAMIFTGRRLFRH